MRGINLAGVIKGGLLAGLIINISEFLLNAVVAAEWMAEEMRARNLPDMGGGGLGIFVVMCFLLGIFLVWLYAAIRPRFGPGPSTAVCAGLIVWGLAYLWPSIGMAVMGMFSMQLLALGVVWGAAEMVVASWVGGWMYLE